MAGIFKVVRSSTMALLFYCAVAGPSQAIDLSATTDASSPTTAQTLIHVSTVDGTQTLAGTPGAAAGARNMDFDRVTGALIATDVFDVQGAVYELDVATGVSSVRAMVQNNGSAVPLGPVAFAPNGTLYAVAGFNTLVGHELGVVDLEAQSFVPVLSFPPGRLYTGLDFTPDGTLYAAYTAFPRQTLEVIDVGIPAVVAEIPAGNFSIGDIDFAEDGFIYHSNSSFNLFRMDPVTGQQTNLGFGELGALAGVASAGALPNTARNGYLGEVVLVEVDTGTGRFAGRGVGSVFSAVFNYGTDETFASEIFSEANERNYLFLAEPFRSTLYDGATSAASLEVSVNVQDNVALDADEAALLSQLLGQVVNEGTLVDTLALNALGIGAYEEDPDPDDQNDEELLFDGVLFDMVFIDLNGDLHDGLDYPTSLPGVADVDLVIFTVTEAGAAGNVLYAALGVVSSLVGDGDGDGIGDLSDNCQLAANLDQIDSNGDGFGNACDTDLNDDCVVNFSDLGLLKSVFFSADADADFNGDGAVNFFDLAVMKAGFFGTPGPTALPNGCL